MKPGLILTFRKVSERVFTSFPLFGACPDYQLYDIIDQNRAQEPGWSTLLTLTLNPS